MGDSGDEDSGDDDLPGDGKRGATYTMLKNVGLKATKKKEDRTKVKKRRQFERAKKRRKGQVREIRTGEMDAYEGEASGIRMGVTRSRKF